MTAGFLHFDPETDTIRLNGSATVMLTLLMKAKFGERFDPETLFHRPLADLIRQLDGASNLPPRQSGDCFTRDDLACIAREVFAESSRSGWWSMSAQQRIAYLQVAAAPWNLSNEQIEMVRQDVDDLLFRSRQIVAAAEDGAGVAAGPA
ncbi:hypothetical protein K9B35_17065 [Sphingomonas sp. R647]|uniref:hypothetical protein n=1 Tax=Sphingomonas sp. R647 TaxID=2875233 RepID=UPI001CD7695A|nr:hypothetical protein [Sphingomonas sp. R647]MCA1199680.1 hypothetical protein [Sphingomonas sp. R647]